MVSDKGKILVLGGTGAMGVYLVPELADMGYEVHVVSLDDAISHDPQITYIKADGTDDNFLREQLRSNYEGIVDFLLNSSTEKFAARHKWILKSTGHYIFLSSYRVYSEGKIPLTENSPRLLDVSQDSEFLATNDYSLYKARNEDTLKKSKYSNWTIVRPAITYSKRKFQLVTLEANVVVYRASKRLPVVLPEAALPVRGTMSWAGDVARMIARLLLNTQVYRETFTLATAEHHSWKEIAEIYREILGLEYIAVDTEDYLRILAPMPEEAYKHAMFQLIYDRLFDRVVDNSKILNAAGMKQSDLTPLREGLKRELGALPEGAINPSKDVNGRMDEYLNKL